MYKLYNPDDREFLLFVGGVEVRIPSRAFVVKDFDDKTLRDFKEAAPAIEVVVASETEINPPKAKLGKGAKK